MPARTEGPVSGDHTVMSEPVALTSQFPLRGAILHLGSRRHRTIYVGDRQPRANVAPREGRKRFTDQTGPLSDDTSACVNAWFQSFDLRTMMLSNPAPVGEETAMIQGMAGFLIAVSCLNEEEYQVVSPGLDPQADGREALQCITNTLGGPEEIAASLESKEGAPPMAFFNAEAKCGLDMIRRTAQLSPRVAALQANRCPVKRHEIVIQVYLPIVVFQVFTTVRYY